MVTSQVLMARIALDAIPARFVPFKIRITMRIDKSYKENELVGQTHSNLRAKFSISCLMLRKVSQGIFIKEHEEGCVASLRSQSDMTKEKKVRAAVPPGDLLCERQTKLS